MVKTILLMVETFFGTSLVLYWAKFHLPGYDTKISKDRKA